MGAPTIDMHDPREDRTTERIGTFEISDYDRIQTEIRGIVVEASGKAVRILRVMEDMPDTESVLNDVIKPISVRALFEGTFQELFRHFEDELPNDKAEQKLAEAIDAVDKLIALKESRSYASELINIRASLDGKVKELLKLLETA